MRTLGLLLAASAMLGADTGQIHWFKNLKQGIDAARESNRPMLIDFWADWCAPCKEMDANVYTNPAVAEAVGKRLVAVRIHLDMQPEVARKYAVEKIPDLIFTNSYGMEMMRHRGMMNAATLAAVVNALPADVSEVNGLDRRLQQKRNDVEALAAMGRSLRERGFYEASGEYFSRAIQQDESRRRPELREAAFLEMGLDYLELKDARRAAQAFERGVKEFPRSARRAEMLRGLARAYQLGGQEDKARRVMDALAAERP
jgi:thioredoxin-like negative regulator of GroEL